MASLPCPKCGGPGGPGHVCPGAAEKLIGRVLDGRFRIEAVIGEGGMGSVYRALQTSIQRPVALKTLHPSLANSGKFFERFRREAEMASKLRHPNIITIFDFGRAEDGTCYLVMELIEGQSIRQLVREIGPLSIRRAVAMIEQTAHGLAHAHAMGCIHRDLKPHNLMVQQLDGREFVKILDFGLVKVLEEDKDQELTSTGQVLGTPQYMPPEQASGETLDARADLYSLGAVFFFCLTGTSPYGANSVRKALTAALHQPLPTVNSRRNGAPVPAAVDDFLHKALAPERRHRHANAEQFIAELLASVSELKDAQLDAVPGEIGREPVPSLPPKAKSARASAPSPRSPRPTPAPVALDQRRTTPERRALKLPSRQVLRWGAGALAAAALGLLGAVAIVHRNDSSPEHVEWVAQPPPNPTLADPASDHSGPPGPPPDLVVTFRSNPTGAGIFENDNQLGTTPAPLRLSRGKHQLTFRLAGREDVHRSIDFSHLAEDHTTLEIDFPEVKVAPPPRHHRTPRDSIPVFE